MKNEQNKLKKKKDSEEETKIKIEALSDYDQKEEKRKINKKRKQVFHKWQNLEKVRYMIFLSKYYEFLESQKLSDKSEWYHKMSACVGSNNYSCGHYYHRRYMNKFHNIKGVMNHLKNALIFDEELLKTEFQRISVIIKEHNQRILDSFDNNFECVLEKRLFKENDVGEIEFVKQQIRHEVEIESEINDFKIDKQVSFALLLAIEIQQAQIRNNELLKMDEIMKGFRGNKSEKELQPQKRRLIRKNKKNRNQSKNTRKKKIFVRKFFKKIENQPNQQEEKIKEECLTKKTIRTFWTKPESIKMIIFLYVNKKFFQTKYLDNSIDIYQKCSQYINTSKSPHDCRLKMRKLRFKYKGLLQRVIEEEAKRLDINLETFEKEKNKCNLIYGSELKCKVRFQNFAIKSSIDVQESNLNSEIEKNLILAGKVHVSFEFQEQISNLNESKDEENSPVNKSQTKRQEIKQSGDTNKQDEDMVKTIVKIKIQKNLFELIKNNLKSSKRRQIIKMRNYIVIKIKEEILVK